MTKVFLFIFIIFLTSCISNGTTYKIDKTISPKIDSIFSANLFTKNSIRPEFSFHAVKTYDFEKFQLDDAMDLSYFLKNGDFPDSQFVGSISQCYLSKDTIVIEGDLGYVGGVGFSVRIFGDKFDCQTILETSKEVYSETNNSKKFFKNILLKSDSQTMVLTEKPISKIGTIIKGMASVKPKPFFQLDNTGKPVKIFTQFNLIFDTKVAEKSED